jgi:hypothetical protein
MLFLAQSHNTGDITPYLRAETARVIELQQAGVIEMVFLKSDMSGAILLVRAADLAAARDAIESLPLVVNGLSSAEFTEVIIPEFPGTAANLVKGIP